MDLLRIIILKNGTKIIPSGDREELVIKDMDNETVVIRGSLGGLLFTGSVHHKDGSANDCRSIHITKSEICYRGYREESKS